MGISADVNFSTNNDIATNNLTPDVIPFSLVLTASYRTVIYFSNKQKQFQFVQEGEVLVILWKSHSALCSPVFKIAHKQNTQMLLAKHIKPLH